MNDSDMFDDRISDIVRTNLNLNSEIDTNPFEQILSLGELVDRLSIVNIKLYNLKNSVMRTSTNDGKFHAHATVLDVRLVEERSRLKNAIDEKLIYMVKKQQNDIDGNFHNPEVKDYG